MKNDVIFLVIGSFLAIAIIAIFNKKQSIDLESDMALSMEEMQDKDESAYHESFEALQNDIRGDIDVCLLESKERNKNKQVPGRGKHYQWYLNVLITSKNGTGKVDDVSLATDSSWPPYFDDEAKNCYIYVIKRRTFSTSHDFSYKCSMSFCLSPPQPNDNRDNK